MINFAASLNKKSNVTYVWNKTKVIKNSFNTIEWRKWQNKDRRETVIKELEKITPPWVERKNKCEIKEEEGQEKEKRKREEKEEENFNGKFKEEELKRAIRNVKKNSSPG